MSTPRKRWFKQDDSILRDPWPREEKLAIVLLRAYLNTRVSRDGIPYRNAGRAQLSAGAVFDITGCDMQDGANLLASVGRKVGFRVGEVDGFITIEWPKFAKEQDYSSRSPGKSPGRDEPSHVPEAGPLRSPLSALRSPEEDLNLKTPLSPPAAQGGSAPVPELKLEPRKRKAREVKAETEPRPATDAELEQLRSWCRRQIDPDLRAEEPRVAYLVERCVDHFRAKPRAKDRCKADWLATWRNWIARDVEINGPPPKVNGAQAPAKQPWEMTPAERELWNAEIRRNEELAQLRENARK